MTLQPDSSETVPRCPCCGWSLRFAAEGYSWVARCWNKRPPAPCPVDVVPPTLNQALIDYLREKGEADSTIVAMHFGWTIPNATNHLTKLLKLGIVTRRPVPSRHGKRFGWRVARAS